MTTSQAASRKAETEPAAIRRRSLIVLSIAAILASIWPGAALAYEEPAYSVAQSEADFELRLYPPYLVAETDAPGDFTSSRSEAFRRLFDYISGANVAKQAVEMTAPVVTSPAEDSSVEIEMTAPVVTQPAPDGRTMQFVLPSRFTAETAPVPSDPRVRIRQLEERWVAVRRYSGTWSERNFRRHEATLRDHLEANGLVAVGPASFAGYNPPFMPWFMRRNEVMIPVRRPSP